MVRHHVYRAGLSALSALRLHKLTPPPADWRGFVLTLHHVRPEPNPAFSPNGGLSISPAFLDRLLGSLKKSGWRFVPLDWLLSAPRGESGRQIAVTLDDGYRNNLTYAEPVFRRHRVPFTIFVCPGFCDATSELWWEGLERIIAERNSVPAPRREETLPSATLVEKNAAFQAWRVYLTETLDETEQRWAFRRLAGECGVNLAELARELVMTWDEVRLIAADPLCSIGAHTLTHPALARLPAEAALAEMRGSADRIEAELGTRPDFIAFPYGYRAAAGPREAELANEAGFRGSFTTRPGIVRNGHQHGLPRISVNGFHQSIAATEALLNPWLWNLRDAVAGRPG